MQPVQRSTFLIINPSDSSGTANLAISVPQDASAVARCRLTSPSAAGGASTSGAVSGADTQPPTLPTARATLQAQLPPVRSGRTVVANERRRMAAATSLIVVGSAGVTTSIGMFAYVFARSAVVPVRTTENELKAAIGGAMVSGIAGVGCIAAGVALLNVRSAYAPMDVEAQIQRAPLPLPIRHVLVELQSIVVEPNVVNTSAAGAAQAESNPAPPRWNAAAASSQLPFSNDQD